MADTEIIKLKKEIHHLKEQTADLQEELEEKNQKLGQMETEYLKMKNETMLITKTKLMQHQEMIKINVEKALEGERARIIFIEQNYEEALQKIAYFEQEKINLENHQKELQIQNNQLKRQLQDFGQKTQTIEFIQDIKEREDALRKKDQEYQKLVIDWNQLCDKMEDILSENRLLKELANVPANFGINIEEIKMGDRLKIEDYKAKIRILQREVDDLETERAQLKHKLIFLANALEIKEPPFSMLTTEQKKTVADYAQSLYEGRQFIVPERYELMKENQNLKNKIEFLEKQIASMQLEGSYRVYGLYNHMGKSDKHTDIPDNFKDIIEMLKKENDDLRQLLSKSLDKISNFNEEMLKTGFNKTNQQDISGSQQRIELSYMQLPPIPLIDNKDIDNTGYGYSYRLNTKVKIDPNQIHSLFGIAKNDNDVDALKIESASLQIQMIELLEVISRMRTQDEFLNENLEKLYNKLENIVLLQNELFEKHVHEGKHFRTMIEENGKTNKSLLEELHDLKRKYKAIEDIIALIETKNLSQIENRAIEKMKDNAILENNYIKLLRKYESLTEEESKLRKFAEDLEKNSADKDLQLENTITKLKEWKQILAFYLKFLIKKLKKSVDRDEFDRVLEENKYLREKYNEMVVRDINITKQISITENIKIKLKELEQNFFNSEEMRIDSEIELNYVKRKLQESDPQYYAQEKVFRKFVQKLNEFKLSFGEIRKVFDPDNSGKITKSEFIVALKTLKMYESFVTSNENHEIDLLIKSLNLDEDDNLDTFYFIRKLERIGVLEENFGEGGSNEEKFIQEFVEGIKNSKMSLKSVFELVDSSGDGTISREEFKFALTQLNLNPSDEMMTKIILLINGGGSTSLSNTSNSFNSQNQLEFINYNQFCELFDQRSKYISLKNRKNQQFKNNLKIDWKTNLLSMIVDGIRKNNLTYMEAFQYLDKDHSGTISKEEFTLFLRRIKVSFTEKEIETLYQMLDKNSDNKIAFDEFINILRECEEKIQVFRKLTNLDDDVDETPRIGNNDNYQPKVADRRGSSGFDNNKTNSVYRRGSMLDNNNTNNTDIKAKNKLALITEKERYYTYKINQMRNRLEEMEKMNKETGTQLEDYVKKHAEMMEKYFSSSEELQKFRTIYETSGVKREDLNKIENENDSLTREVTVLRVGLNTFKDLYKSSSRQIQILTLKSQRNDDEIDTYKKAVKDLQSESNSNALIGKLYYSLLISRWRESNTLRKYDDFINELATMREENFRCETDNKKMVKEVAELQTVLHDKIIENIRLVEQYENATQGFGIGGSGITHVQLEELKQLMRDMATEKTELTEKYFNIRRDNLRLNVELEELRNKVEYSEALVNRIKYNNMDEYSKKLISVSEEVSKIKLNETVLTRENHFLKETESYLNRLVEHLNKSVKSLEVSNAEWEGKFRKMEEVWRKRDEERQKKFFEYVKSLSINDMKSLASVNGSNVGLPQNFGGNLQKFSEYENKLKELNDVIAMKNNEISMLINSNKENEDLLKEHANNVNNLGIIKDSLLTKTNLDLIKDDETQLVAQTAHKTIKTLQDLLNNKNSQLSKKDETIENLKNDSIKNKEHYLRIISKLQEQIQLDHDTTMKKLKNVLDTVHANLFVKITKSQLSTMTLADIEALLEEKDNSIKALAVELKHTKDENEINYVKIQDLNKRITDLTFNLTEKRFMSNAESQTAEIERLKKVINEKTDLIEEERARIKKLSEEFGRKFQDRSLLEDQIFYSSVHVPERLVENTEKAQMFSKVQSLRNKNKKLIAEIDKLNKVIEENKKQVEDSSKTLEKIKNENKMFLQTQIKDTKTISRLKKEKEELTIDRDKFKERCETLQKLMDQQQAATKPTNTIVGSAKRGMSAPRKKPLVAEKEPKEKEINVQPKTPIIEVVKTSTNEIKEESSDDVLKRLVYFCLKKNINMLRHLQRYDITKLGKITKTDFAKAIEELKLGFIDYDITKLLELSKIVDNYVEIQQFISIMVDKDKNYDTLIKENEFLFDSNSMMKRQPSRKYNPFETKAFNINY